MSTQSDELLAEAARLLPYAHPPMSADDGQAREWYEARRAWLARYDARLKAPPVVDVQTAVEEPCPLNGEHPCTDPEHDHSENRRRAVAFFDELREAGFNVDDNFEDEPEDEAAVYGMLANRFDEAEARGAVRERAACLAIARTSTRLSPNMSLRITNDEIAKAIARRSAP